MGIWTEVIHAHLAQSLAMESDLAMFVSTMVNRKFTNSLND